ncbi:UNVERIFIED_CONTAM: hypothetical protein Sradi_3319200 [Sesamum radiatum]|uniref:Uncharacterized protein n=1 Tax=Sesamum radiatum TaxID=300843 RepID=A0AAW2R1Z3_SESRA
MVEGVGVEEAGGDSAVVEEGDEVENEGVRVEEGAKVENEEVGGEGVNVEAGIVCSNIMKKTEI